MYRLVRNSHHVISFGKEIRYYNYVTRKYQGCTSCKLTIEVLEKTISIPPNGSMNFGEVVLQFVQLFRLGGSGF
jgi:hypothetical protein